MILSSQPQLLRPGAVVASILMVAAFWGPTLSMPGKAQAQTAQAGQPSVVTASFTITPPAVFGPALM